MVAGILLYYCRPQVISGFLSRGSFFQVRINGRVEKVSPEESSEKFNSKPKSYQVGAIISHQSNRLPDRVVSIFATIFSRESAEYPSNHLTLILTLK